MINTGTFDNPKWRVRKAYGQWHVLRPFSWQLGVINGFASIDIEFETQREAMAHATTNPVTIEVLS